MKKLIAHSAQKKIVLVLPSLHAGGMERVMSELATCFFEKHQAKIDLVLLGVDEHFYALPKGILIHEPDFDFNKKKQLTSTIKTMLYLRKKLHELQPDAVLSFGEMYNSFVLIASIFTKYSIFVSDRSKPDRNWGSLHHLLRFLSYHRAKGIIAQTELAKKAMQKRLWWSNIEMIGNPIKPTVLNRDASYKRKNIILTVGRMIKSKRHHLLIQLFHQTDYRNWQLFFLGDGPEKDNLEKLARELSLNDHIHFYGNQKDLEPFYQQAKIFAFTSNSEGFPNALGEAMSAGLAPITFDFIAGASDMIVNESNGFLVPMDDENQFVFQLNRLMQNQVLIESLGNEATVSIKKFDRDIISSKYYSFILS